MSSLIFYAGFAQLCILFASSLVPSQLDWKNELKSLSKLHRQMYWVYGGYVVMGIAAIGLMCVFNSKELANGSGLATSVSLYITTFWGVRLILQVVFDAKPFLTKWWLHVGYHLLTVLFFAFTALFGYVAISSILGNTNE